MSRFVLRGRRRVACGLAACLVFSWPALAASRVEIRDGRFYVDQHPFLIKAVAYGPWRPRQKPGTSYAATNRDLTRRDFERIKAAHFNSIRSWEPLEPDDLALAAEFDLMVLQGIRLDPRQNFANPHNVETAVEQVRLVAEKSRDHPNVLGYLVMGRLDPETVIESGPSETGEFFRRLQRAIQSVDPRPVAWEGHWPTAFLPDPDSDFSAFSAFAFWPRAMTEPLGYAGVVRWLKDRRAQRRPLILTETGGYSVSQASWSVKGGFGGLSEYDQGIRNLDSLRATVEGHAEGSALVSWIDGWYAAGDSDVQSPEEPWEWTGVLAVTSDSKRDRVGRPRQQWEMLKDFNQLVPVEPKANHFYHVQTAYPVEIAVSPETAGMRFSVNEGEWKPLSGTPGSRFYGSFTLPKLARRRVRLNFQALNQDGTVLAQKDISVLAAITPEAVVLTSAADKKKAGNRFAVTVKDGEGQAAANRAVTAGCYLPVSGQEQVLKLKTGLAGTTAFSCDPVPGPKDRYLFVAAGTDSPQRVRAFDLQLFELASSLDRSARQPIDSKR